MDQDIVDLLCITDLELHVVSPYGAAVTNLSAGLSVKRRPVEHYFRFFSFARFFNRLILLYERDNVCIRLQCLIPEEFSMVKLLFDLTVYFRDFIFRADP